MACATAAMAKHSPANDLPWRMSREVLRTQAKEREIARLLADEKAQQQQRLTIKQLRIEMAAREKARQMVGVDLVAGQYLCIVNHQLSQCQEDEIDFLKKSTEKKPTVKKQPYGERTFKHGLQMIIGSNACLIEPRLAECDKESEHFIQTVASTDKYVEAHILPVIQAAKEAVLKARIFSTKIAILEQRIEIFRLMLSLNAFKRERVLATLAREQHASYP